MPDGNRQVASQQRAVSLFTLKSVDNEQRVITGIASTPEVDRMGDIVEPKGAVFKLPLPLLYQHNSRQPIGQVTVAKATDAGIEITARIAKGVPVAFIDEAWELIKAGLVPGFSIGFSPIEYSYMKEGGVHYTKSEIYEISCVTIPANASANIQTIKSIDSQQRAASGNALRPVVHLKTLPGASGNSAVIPKGTDMKTIAEQIASFEAKRAATVARREAVQQKAIDDNRSKDATEREEFDGCTAEIDSIDAELKDLRVMEAQAVKGATHITKTIGADPGAAAGARGGHTVDAGEGRVTHVQPNIEKGIPFTRYVLALARAGGNLTGALAIAQNNKKWMDQTPQVAEVLKSAVAGGDTTTSGWASELVYNRNLVDQFIEVLRPQTIIGRIPGLTRVPFNVRIAGASSGTSANWVGQGKPIPVSKMVTTSTSLGIAKAAGLVVLTQELVRSSDPSAELMVQNDLIAAIAQFLDQQFIDPNYAAVTNVSPASITYGITGLQPTGTTSTTLRADVQTLFGTWITNNLDPSSAVWVMTPTSALAISLMLTSLGTPVFPQMTPSGGTFMGYPVIVSQSAQVTASPDQGSLIVLINAREILLADDGQVVIDASAEASLEMLDNPTNNAAAGTPTTMVSMYQTNSVALRAVRFINWAKRRSTAVQYIHNALYVS